MYRTDGQFFEDLLACSPNVSLHVPLKAQKCSERVMTFEGNFKKHLKEHLHPQWLSL